MAGCTSSLAAAGLLDTYEAGSGSHVASCLQCFQRTQAVFDPSIFIWQLQLGRRHLVKHSPSWL